MPGCKYDWLDNFGYAQVSDLYGMVETAILFPGEKPGCGNTFIRTYQFRATDICGNTNYVTAAQTTLNNPQAQLSGLNTTQVIGQLFGEFGGLQAGDFGKTITVTSAACLQSMLPVRAPRRTTTVHSTATTRSTSAWRPTPFWTWSRCASIWPPGK